MRNELSPKGKNYVQRFAKSKGISEESALQLRVVQEVLRQYQKEASDSSN